ncbi:hypothetical protein D9M69_525280 [compost metagenome]
MFIAPALSSACSSTWREPTDDNTVSTLSCAFVTFTLAVLKALRSCAWAAAPPPLSGARSAVTSSPKAAKMSVPAFCAVDTSKLSPLAGVPLMAICTPPNEIGVPAVNGPLAATTGGVSLVITV